jgi:hypothetical protein
MNYIRLVRFLTLLVERRYRQVEPVELGRFWGEDPVRANKGRRNNDKRSVGNKYYVKKKTKQHGRYIINEGQRENIFSHFES